MPTATLDGTTLHYLDEGSGHPAVVLLHAFPLHAGMWERQIDALAERVRVVAPDLVGFGGSDAPEDPSAYSVDGWADDVARLLDHLGLDRVVVAGQSMGAYVAFSFLRRHRSRLAGLVLADTRPTADSAEARDRRVRQQEQMSAGGEAGKAEVVEGLLQTLLCPDTLEHRLDVVETARRLMDNPPHGLVGALEAMKRRPDSVGDLATVDVPTLVLVGDQDAPSPPEVAQSMQQGIPGAELVVVPGAGHLSGLEAPEAFNAALVDFVSRLQDHGPPSVAR
ncbi:MAG: alpha/beta hydrolase [Actinomycetota bacterium]|nr:alpha/beta hydrolase [Actinomycetota bacterium]